MKKTGKNVDMAKLVTPEPRGGVPNLNRAQFEYLVATRTVGGVYLADMIERVLQELKPLDPERYRMLRAKLAGNSFKFVETVAMIQSFRPILQRVFPGETLSEASILGHWNAALEQK